MKNFQFSIFNFQILIIALVILLVPIFIIADEAGQDDFVYLFHLYYDNNRLFADRDFEFKYDVIPEEFAPETLDTQFPFRGEVVNFLDQTAATFRFDPRRGNPGFLKGKINIKAPFVPDGQKVHFYDSQDNHLLTIFVSESSFCNDDSVCNEETGENNQTCPNDCRLATPVPTPPIGGGGQSAVINWLIYGLITAGAAFGGWYGWKWWKSRQKPPLTQLPQDLNVK